MKLRHEKLAAPCLSPEIKKLNGQSTKEVLKKTKELSDTLDRKKPNGKPNLDSSSN